MHTCTTEEKIMYFVVTSASKTDGFEKNCKRKMKHSHTSKTMLYIYCMKNYSTLIESSIKGQWARETMSMDILNEIFLDVVFDVGP